MEKKTVWVFAYNWQDDGTFGSSCEVFDSREKAVKALAEFVEDELKTSWIGYTSEDERDMVIREDEFWATLRSDGDFSTQKTHAWVAEMNVN